jgi:dTDP-glucose 4,6-dehydratase
MTDLARRVNHVVGSAAGVHVAGRPEPDAPRVRYVPDVSAIRHDLGLADPVPIDDAIARTVAWHRTWRNR